MDWEEFKLKVSTVLDLVKDRICLDSTGDKISYSISNYFFRYTKDDFIEFKDSLNNVQFDGLSVETKNSYEVVLYSLSNNSYAIQRFKSFGQVDDNVYNMSYKTDEASDAMIYNILCMIDIENYAWAHLRLLEDNQNQEMYTLFNLLRLFLFNPYTITLYHNNFIDTNKKRMCINSLLFNCAYNYFEHMRIANNLEDFLGPGTYAKFTKLRRLGLSVPKVLYKPYLLDEYQMAASSKDPMIKFIGFYHVMEYFFEQVYKEDLRKTLREILILPDFSATDNEDLNKVIKAFSDKSLESTPGNEIESLNLTLKKYVNINNLIDSISLNNQEMIKYYKTNIVPFSKGSKIDFEKPRDKVLSSIASRIYATRNSIVHGKSNELKRKERPLYRPFKDEEILAKEIPLMQAIAEEIIIKTGEELKL